MMDAGRHPNITLYTYSEVEAISGYVGNFSVRIRKRARSVDEEKCTGCGTCEEKCPRRYVDTGYNMGLGQRKAISRPFAQAVPPVPVIDRENCLFFTKGRCRLCEKVCPAGAIDYEQQDRIVELTVGNVILATGYDPFDARRISQYGYGRYPDVFTSLEVERMLSGSGPTGGRVLLRDGQTVPESVAIIHCVGSRDENYHPYCSKVCCMVSLKLAHLVHDKTGARVYNFYIDMRSGGKGYEEFYNACNRRARSSSMDGRPRSCPRTVNWPSMSRTARWGGSCACRWTWSSWRSQCSRVTMRARWRTCSASPAMPTAGSASGTPNSTR